MVRKKDAYTGGAVELIVETEPKSPISEQFRTIRTNIMYSSIDSEMRSVIFTSASPGAGKSTAAANVAAAFAQSGKRTLLLDADLRRPSTHYTFELNNSRGLSTVIVSNMPAEEAIQQSDIENLDIMTSGPVPPNPSELLSSAKIKMVLQTLSIEYDMVVIDTPPLLAVTDAQVLSKLVDGVLIVTDVKKNDREHLKQAKALLEKADANILGVVMNNKAMVRGREEYYYYGKAGSDGEAALS